MAFDGDFSFDLEIDCFEKAGAGDKSRRIGGFASTADLDKDEEILIQKGLNFQPFLRGGWFNYNHGQGPDDIIGHPEMAQLIQKGEMLPSGKIAHQTGWYVEGYLLKGVKKADDTWQLAQSLQSTNRRLGYSVEGKVLKRMMVKGVRAVAEAVVRNVAITHCPKNDKAALEVLAKSLGALDKALSMGAQGAAPVAGVPMTGATGGVLTPQHLDGYCPACGAKKGKKAKKKISKSEARAVVMTRFPHLSPVDAQRVVLMAMSNAA